MYKIKSGKINSKMYRAQKRFILVKRLMITQYKSSINNDLGVVCFT